MSRRNESRDILSKGLRQKTFVFSATDILWTGSTFKHIEFSPCTKHRQTIC